jgi:hypothetical protein
LSALSLEWLLAVILHCHTATAPPSSSQYSEQSASVDEHAASHRRHPAPSGSPPSSSLVTNCYIASSPRCRRCPLHNHVVAPLFCVISWPHLSLPLLLLSVISPTCPPLRVSVTAIERPPTMCDLGISFCFHHLLLFCRGEGILLLEERDECARGERLPLRRVTSRRCR